MNSQSSVGRVLGNVDPTENPVEWNKGWDLVLERDPGVSRIAKILQKDYASIPERLLTDVRFGLRDLLSIQNTLSSQARLALNNDFEAKWKRCSHATRRNHLLEGLVRAVIMHPEHEHCRLFCSDVTLKAMNDRDGSAFLRVMKEYIDNATAPADTPHHFRHPTWHRHLERARAKDKSSLDTAIWELMQIQRDEYIGSFAIGTLQSFNGEARTSAKTLPLLNPQWREDAAKLKKKLGKDAYKTMVHELKEKKKGAVRQCEACGRVGSAENPLLECRRCLENMKRRVYYCNKDCQRQDWKVHKQICGKPLTLELAKSTVPCSHPWEEYTAVLNMIPPPAAGFSRSLALRTQISKLTELPGNICYVLFSENGTCHNVSIEEAAHRLAFVTTRNEAFEDGSTPAVAALSQYLVQHGARLAGANIPTSAIIKQLSSEFPGVEIAQAVRMMDFALAQDTRTRGRTAIEIQVEHANDIDDICDTMEAGLSTIRDAVN